MGKPLPIVSTVVALAIAPAAQGARTTSTTTRAVRPGVSVEQPELYRGGDNAPAREGTSDG